MNLNQLPMLGASLLALGVPAIAQTGGTQKPAPAPAPVVQDNIRLHPLEHLIGLDLKTQDDKDLGEVEELILDSADGSIDYVVVGQGGVLGVGEEKYILPYESIRIVHGDMTKDDDLKATTALTEERIKKAPKYDKDQRIGTDIERSIREAAGLTPEPMQPRAKNSELVAAKKVKGSQVLGATQEKIGELEQVVVDPHAGMVAYNVLASGGTLGLGEKHYALPWEVTRVRIDADNNIVLGSELTKDRLSKAPEYDAKDTKRVAAAPFVREVHTYYSLEPYFSRSTPASAPRVPPQDEKRRDKDGK
jgi:sporulation protein YlmC with PRC-barrel domain